MERQLAEFVSGKLDRQGEPSCPEKVFAMMIGSVSCEEQGAFLEKLHALWGLEEQDVLCQEFKEVLPPQTEGAEEVASPELRRVNGDLDGATLRFAGMQGRNKTICAVVWANDPMVTDATNLLNLAARWGSLNGCGVCRLMLVVMLPRWNGVNKQQAIAAFGLLDKVTNQHTDPVLCSFYGDEDGEAESIAWNTGIEVFFLECADKEDRERRLEDAAYLLSPAAMAGNGIFMPAFREVTRVYKHYLASQIISCIQQIEEEEERGGVGVSYSITDKLRDYVTEEEAPEYEYRKWMRHACLFRSDPDVAALTRESLYGSWLEELADAWCDRLKERELPELFLNHLLQGCTEEQLAIHKDTLEAFVMRTVGNEGRNWDDCSDGDWRDWKEFLDYQLDHGFRDVYMTAVENRINLLVQKMLTLVGAKLKNDAQRGTSQKMLVDRLQRIENETRCEKTFEPRQMDANQCIRFKQILLEVKRGSEKNMEHLLDFVWDLVQLGAPEGDERQTDCVPCCPHMCMQDIQSAYKECYQVHGGRRSGEVLCVQQLNRPNGIQTMELTFFSQNRVRAKKG